MPQQVTGVEYCMGVSPTAGIAMFDQISPREYCEEVPLELKKTYACRACSTVAATSAPLVESYIPGDYLEVGLFDKFFHWQSLGTI